MSQLIPTDGDNPTQIKMPPARVRWVRDRYGVMTWVIALTTQGNG
ncbi:hypothetical protein ABLB84_19700 [Xenorhabdus szentirmaii]|nr:hypothetical protein [Xenorhabdus szentirmaii]